MNLWRGPAAFQPRSDCSPIDTLTALTSHRHIHFSSARLSPLTSWLWRDGEVEERKGKCRVFLLWESNQASGLNAVVSNVLFHQRITCLRCLFSFVFSCRLLLGFDLRSAQVVSLATGTKCLDSDSVSDRGGTLSDCHAEVVNRRALVRFLYAQLELLLRYDPETLPVTWRFLYVIYSVLRLLFLCLTLDFPSSLPSEVSQQTARNDPSSYQIKAAASSDCETASSSTCTSARRRAETLDSTARTRPRLHVRDDADACCFCLRLFDVDVCCRDIDWNLDY